MRHEQKYLISKPSASVLKSLLSATLDYDPHYENGVYTVASLYFDDLSFSAYNEKLNGDSDREKFRIRLYNSDCSYIVLEKKYKKKELVNKNSFLTNKNDVLSVMGGGEIDGDGNLEKEFNAKRLAQGLKPVINVKYERTAFVFPVGDTRITIDENIRFSLNPESLFNDEPFIALPDETSTVLEVKFNDIFPSFVSPFLSTVEAVRTEFSKYAMAVSAIEGSYI